MAEVGVTKIERLGANYLVVLALRARGRFAEREAYVEGNAVTSDAPQAWYVMLKDEDAAGKVIVPLKPFLRFSRRMDKQLARLERRIQEQIPQLRRRGQAGRRSRWRPSDDSGS